MPQSTDNNKTTGVLAKILENGSVQTDWPKEGSLVEVKFLKNTARAAYFDMGRFGTGSVFGLELQNAREIVRNLKPGDKLPAKIVAIDSEEGYVELSLVEADKQRLWTQVKELQESGDVIKVKIVSANAGGLTAQIADLDLKAFLPVSQLSNDHFPKDAENDREKMIAELKKFVGQELNVKVIDANPRTNKLILSERESLSANVKELLQKYKVGEDVQCLVTGIADFGIFVRFIDTPEIEGLIHISEIEHRVIESPKELVKINDTLKAKIIDIREGRVFLSLKALKVNPWEKASERYKAGDAVSGKVYKFNPFGAIVNLDDHIQGMIHISEFGGMDEMKKALIVGESYPFMIDSVKPEEKRIILKARK